MLYPQDIIDRLKELVEEKFPGEPVYLDPLPNGFERPSNYIQLQKFPGDAGFAPRLVEFSPVIALTTFPEIDAFKHSSQREVNRRQMLLTAILMPGFVKVKDRAPKVAKLELEGGWDFASVTVTFSYAVSREEFLELEEAPAMEEFRFTERPVGAGITRPVLSEETAYRAGG